jgi:hypothetical protein
MADKWVIETSGGILVGPFDTKRELFGWALNNVDKPDFKIRKIHHPDIYKRFFIDVNDASKE